jgi:hypothetical protein
VKDKFYEEFEHVSHKFPKYHMKMLLGDFNAEVGREDIFNCNCEKLYMKLEMIMELQ